MISDTFKKRYDRLPIAVSRRNWDAPLPEKAATFCHNHREAEMVLVLKGQGTLHLGNGRYPIQEGDAFFVSPYDLHYTVVEKGNIYVSLCICFDPVLLGDTDFAEALEAGEKRLSPVICNNDTVNMHLRHIYRAVSAENEEAYWEATGHLFLLFAYLRKNGFAEAADIGKNGVFCKGVLAFLNENYEKDISSKDVASALYQSQGHFCRCFRQNFGESFSLYLRRYRLEKAKEKLLTSSLSVSEVAQNSGFSDAAYFTKCFREAFGDSPKIYRNKKNGTA